MRRLRECVERWPECIEGAYDPRCCRFPKSCSCTIYDEQSVTESDLEDAEGYHESLDAEGYALTHDESP